MSSWLGSARGKRRWEEGRSLTADETSSSSPATTDTGRSSTVEGMNSMQLCRHLEETSSS
uniref:Uncharacterized protein n=1 Tax=Oryza nivara TaxID=4536 RepID=A0A0E0IHH8_ORYNI